MKTGRNDPCPCGSGKKYKHCHLRADEAAAAPPPPDDRSQAVSRALGWLHQRHRKAFGAAMGELIDELWPDDDDAADIADLSHDERTMVGINLTEWLLAQGEIQVHGRWVDVPALLLGADGPSLSAPQRQWLHELAQRPLRLYTVTEVRAGDNATFCDALDADAAPLTVVERTATRTMEPGLLVGARLLPLDGGRWELSGALYPFAPLWHATVVTAVRAEVDHGWHADDVPDMVALCIVRQWLRQWALPARVPPLVDAMTGDAMLLVTDHYRVVDAAALAGALAACADVGGDAAGGWRREVRGDDGITRSLATITPGRGADRVEVFYRTQRLADEGRAWFEGVAGDAVRHVAREVVDPTSPKALAGAGRRGGTDAPQLPPEELARLIGDALQRSYANWADEPVPALGGLTPRQAAATAAGLERVKGLLRSYAAGEAKQAAGQGRAPMSYDFLWRQLGLEPPP